MELPVFFTPKVVHFSRSRVVAALTATTNIAFVDTTEQIHTVFDPPNGPCRRQQTKSNGQMNLEVLIRNPRQQIARTCEKSTAIHDPRGVPSTP